MIRAVRADGTIETGGAFAPIRRVRVIERLSAAALQRIVLLIAPAGYGKSVALRQFLSVHDEAALRFDVYSDHTTLLGFLRGFSEAIARVAPEARETLAGAYERNAASPNAGVDLALWMHSHLRSFRGTIAIDDLHIAQDDREVTRFLTSLIERTKDRVQWVIASRATTGLPIGTWLAYGESDLAVDEHDLRFTQEEAREAARAFRLGVRDEELNDLLSLTEGWATAMSFALRTSVRSIDIRAISATTRDMIFAYLAEQVYGSLDEEERAFLEVATQFQRIDLRLLIAAGFDNAVALIERLQARVAFLHEEDEHPGIYRCHDLFREFVARQMDLRGYGYALEVRARVAAVLEEHDLIAAALALRIASKDTLHTRALLAAHGMDLAARGNSDTVEEGLALVGDATEFQIVALRGMHDITKGKADEGERQIVRAMRECRDARMYADLALRVVRSRLNRGQEARDLLDELLSSDSTPYNEKLEAMSFQAIAFVRDGNTASAREHAEQIAARIDTIDDTTVRARLAQRTGVVFTELKEYERAEKLLEQAAVLASSASQWSLVANAYQARSVCVLFSRNDTATALELAQKASRAAEQAGDLIDLVRAQLSMLSVEVRRGNGERAVEIERVVATMRPGDPAWLPYLASSQAHRAAWKGEFSASHRLFASVLDRQSSEYDKAFVRAAYALTLALDGRTADSGKAADSFVAMLSDEAAFPPLYDSVTLEAARLFCALSEAISGRHTRAQKLFKLAPRSVHAVSDYLRSSAEQLARGAKSPSYVFDGLNDAYAIISAHGYGSYGRYLARVEEWILERHTDKHVEVRLTAQEVKIVRLLADGMTPKDIAAELGRSVYTVQTHIQNVIEKLGCHGRAEAIVAARRLGIL